MDARRYLACLSALLIALTGCEKSPTDAADTAFDARAADRNVQHVTSILDGAMWESFRVLGARFTFGSGAASLPLSAMSVVRETPLVNAAVSSLLVPRLPFEIRGTTFVLDPTTLRYVPDPERSGAPDNGVRFILYAVDPVTGEPQVDTETGHADLTDEGDALPSAVRLRLEIVSAGVTFLDYLVTAGGTDTAGGLSASGFVTGPDARVDFGITVNHQSDGDTEAMEVQFGIAIPERRFHARATVRNVRAADGAMGQVAMQVDVGDATVGFTAEGSDAEGRAVFSVNDRLFATVTSGPDGPVIRGEGGRELVEAERQALHGLMTLTGHVFEMFNHLMQPVGSIVAVEILPVGT